MQELSTPLQYAAIVQRTGENDLSMDSADPVSNDNSKRLRLRTKIYRSYVFCSREFITRNSVIVQPTEAPTRWITLHVRPAYNAFVNCVSRYNTSAMMLYLLYTALFLLFCCKLAKGNGIKRLRGFNKTICSPTSNPCVNWSSTRVFGEVSPRRASPFVLTSVGTRTVSSTSRGAFTSAKIESSWVSNGRERG